MNVQPQNNQRIQTNNSCYQLTDRILGTGAFGTVQIGVNVVTQQEVAVKIMPVDYLQQAQNQIQILKQLGQKSTSNQQWNQNQWIQNGLKIHGSHRSYNSVYIVTEIFGRALTALMQQTNKSDVITSLTIFKSIVQALQPLRKRRILHRDIKPDNILIQFSKFNNSYKAKLCDFGLSAIEKDSKVTLMNSERVGTLIYQSPQVIKFKEYSEKSEVWSLGIILYELIYKRLPFQKADLSTKNIFYQKLMTKSIKFIGIPKKLTQIGQKCLAINSNKRLNFECLKQMVNQVLHSLITNESKSSKTPEVSPTKSQPNKQVDEQPFSQSSISTKQISFKSTSSVGRKASEDIFEQQQNADIKKKLCEMFRILKQRYEKLKRSTKCVSPLLMLCQKIEDESNDDPLSLINLQNLNILNEVLQKMKLMCEFSENQKQISYNLNEFMFTDCLLLIIEIFRSKSNNLQPKITKQLSQFLKESNNARSMQYYRQLRIIVLNCK